MPEGCIILRDADVLRHVPLCHALRCSQSPRLHEPQSVILCTRVQCVIGCATVSIANVHSHRPLSCVSPPALPSVSGGKAEDKSQGPLIGLLKDMGYDSSMVCKQ
jgi:hypothetical protein